MHLAESLPKDLLYSAYRLTASHLAPDGTSKEIFGTCFNVKVGAEIFVVTNKHIFSLGYAHQKYVGYRLNGLMIAGYFGIDQYAECAFINQTVTYAMPENEAEDVVVIDVTNVPCHFRRKRKKGEDPTTKTTSLAPINIDVEMLAKDADLRVLNPGDAIAFPSYPALYDLNGARPIMRTGTIASDPESDYQADNQEPGRRIACEAHSTQGSSGSPVFAFVQSSGELVVIGINAGHLTGDEPKIGTIHSGLSYCFKASCILESIEKLRLAKQA